MPGELAATWIATGLAHGTVLAAITWLLTAALLRRARPALLAALWTVVLLKFLVPIGPRTSLSLSSVLDQLIAHAAGGGGTARGAAGTALAAATGRAGVGGAAPVVLTQALLVAYLVGLAWFAGRRLVRHRALVRQVRALPLAPEAAVDRLAWLASSVAGGLRRLPVVRVAPDACGPYLVGCARPELVTPAWLDPATPAWSAAMSHELAHLVRRDPWLRAVESTVRALFYFWPPVVWVCRRIDRAREMACDQFAVAHGPLGARDYARLLVAFATRAPGAGALVAPGAMALVRTRSQLGARVDRLLAGARPPALGRAGAVIVTAWSSLCLAGAARSSARATPSGPECNLEPGLMVQILATHPDADTDGDGILSQDEACAHQQRMRQRLLDRVVDAELVSRLDPDADLDGDGALSEVEIDSIKDQFELAMAPDGADGVVLRFGGTAVPLPEEEVRIDAAAAPARVCRAARCADGPGQPGRFPLLIDVSLTSAR